MDPAVDVTVSRLARALFSHAMPRAEAPVWSVER